VIVQKNPAIVASPAEKPLWLQAYPHGYHPNQRAAEAMPHKAHPSRIPEAWFAEGQKHAAKQASVVQRAVHQNSWDCQPTHLPCGKTGTDYWACKKQGPHKAGKGELQNVVNHCTSQGGVH
jgi:hypothetical protein